MHFGAAVRDVLSASCGSDLRAAQARTVVPALRSPETLRLLGANLEAAFGITIPAADLEHLTTVRDVLQCVRLRRWIAAVERRSAERPPAAEAPGTPADAAAQPPPEEPRPGLFRFRLTRRTIPTPTPPAAEPPPAGTGTRRA